MQEIPSGQKFSAFKQFLLSYFKKNYSHNQIFKKVPVPPLAFVRKII